MRDKLQLLAAAHEAGHAHQTNKAFGKAAALANRLRYTAAGAVVFPFDSRHGHALRLIQKAGKPTSIPKI